MSGTVCGPDPAGVAATIEANVNASLLSFVRLPGAVRHDEPSIAWVDSGTPIATFNSVARADLAPHVVGAQIEAVIAHFRWHDRPFVWHVGPSTRPADLGNILLAHGLVHVEDEPGMAVRLDHVQADLSDPPGLTIETVRDDRGLAAWVSVWLFPLPCDARHFYFDALLGRGLGDDVPWRYYVGRLDGEPVATSALFVGGGAAGVEHVVTVPAARRRGIGTAMTLQVLRGARAMGLQLAALTASPDGIGSYRRIGFREYCRFRRYEWGKDGGLG